MSNSETIIQRIHDWKGFCKSRGLTYKEVSETAGFDYDSVKSNMNSTLQGASGISDDRMTLLEETAISLSEQKTETA